MTQGGRHQAASTFLRPRRGSVWVAARTVLSPGRGHAPWQGTWPEGPSPGRGSTQPGSPRVPGLMAPTPNPAQLPGADLEPDYSEHRNHP